MKIRNVHQRSFAVPPGRAGALIDTLASADDRLWPRQRWPRMRFDRPLSVGAGGGHGPVRYTVVAYEPGRRVEFRFNAPRGFVGWHGFDVATEADGRSVLRHVADLDLQGPALLTWPLFFRPLHDALIEDALDNAERELSGSVAHPARWSPAVRVLRALGNRRGGTRRPRG